MKTAIILGAGAFGTAIGHVLSQQFDRVILKIRNEQLYQEIKQGRNERYLPGQALSPHMLPAMTWEEVKALTLGEVEIVVSGLPTEAIDACCQADQKEIAAYLKKGIPFVSLSKGISAQSLQLPDEMYEKHFADFHDQFTYLSGPSFAQEIVDQQITLVSLAGRDRQILKRAADLLQTPYFKCFPTYDVKGVLLGGALKNVLAIAGGIIEGLGYNHNTRAAMITRGIVEMLRFGVVYNARPETFYSFSGMGDLILTTTGDLSRNKKFGLELASGKKAQDIIRQSASVVEGYKTTLAAYKIAEKFELRTQLFNGMYKVLYENKDPRGLIQELMELPTRFSEDD